MKRLYINLFLFIVPIALVVLVIPIDKLKVYQGLKNDCMSRGIWIYDRLFENPVPIDIAFLGSSHTINSVNDELIETELSGLESVNVVNFGYCRLGRNLTYALVEEIIVSKKVNALVIEVREDEDRYSHPMFPYIARGEDVLMPVLLFNRDIGQDYFDHVSYKVALIQDELFAANHPHQASLQNHGFAPVPDTATIELMNEARATRDKSKYDLDGIERDFYMSFPRTYLNKIALLCDQHKIRMYFLYLPAFGWGLEVPSEMETYKKHGRVLIPPMSIFEDLDNWYDPNHLNEAGAEQLSTWLASEFKEISN